MTRSDVRLFWLAAGPDYRVATLEELHFLKRAGALSPGTGKCCLISLDLAIAACKRAGVPALVLAAMAAVPDLQPHTPPPPQAQPRPEQHVPPPAAGQASGAQAHNKRQHAVQRGQGEVAARAGPVAARAMTDEPPVMASRHPIEESSAYLGSAAAVSGVAGRPPLQELQPSRPTSPAGTAMLRQPPQAVDGDKSATAGGLRAHDAAGQQQRAAPPGQDEAVDGTGAQVGAKRKRGWE